MVGLLIATHGGLAKTLVECADLILGKTDGICSMGLFHGDSIDQFKIQMKENIQNIDNGNGVLVLTDLCGGSPSNLSVFLMKEFEQTDIHIESIVGVNIPILLEAIEAREEMKLDELVLHLMEAGKNSIVNIRQFYDL